MDGKEVKVMWYSMEGMGILNRGFLFQVSFVGVAKDCSWEWVGYDREYQEFKYVKPRGKKRIK